jgi:hypothetical protein
MKGTRALSLGFCLLLTACGGGSASVACTQDFWDGTIGTCFPDGWSEVDRETLLQRGVSDETIAVFRSEDSISGHFPTVVVTREPLAQEILPADYSEANIRSVTVLPAYQEIDIQEMEIDDEEVQLHIFSAQPLKDEPGRRFFQVSTVHAGVGYTLTASLPLFVDQQVESEVELILKSTTFREPAE